MTNPVYVALDTPDPAAARALATRVRHHVGGLKLGLEFFAANGRVGVHEMASFGLPIFLDLKLHDIPNTVAGAIAALRGLEPAILTVHAAGGQAMMEEARAAAPAGTKVVAVTVLTSLDGPDLASIGLAADPRAQVARLTALARDAGLDGVVCSGGEVAAARAIWPDGFLVVPGLRLADGDHGDQKRVITPRAARDAGASILVIGRPITAAVDPDAAAREIAATLLTGAGAKICGITTADALDAAVAAGASHVGFVFFAPSPRNLTLDQAAALAARVPPHVGRVGVFVAPDDALVTAAVRAAGLSALQLHGDESPAQVAATRTRHRVELWKAIPVRTRADLDAGRAYHGAADRLLYDAKTPAGSDLPGGLGLRFDWRLLDGFDHRLAWALSGGLDAGNVAEAVAITGARLVDVSSGVESAPGVKDVDKIAAFMQALARS